MEDGQLALQNLVLILGAALELSDSDLKLAVHVILFLLSLALFLFELDLLLADVFEPFLDILKATLGVAVAHHVYLVVGHRLLEVGLSNPFLGQRTLQSLNTGFEVRHNYLAILNLRLYILVLFL